MRGAFESRDRLETDQSTDQPGSKEPGFTDPPRRTAKDCGGSYKYGFWRLRVRQPSSASAGTTGVIQLQGTQSWAGLLPLSFRSRFCSTTNTLYWQARTANRAFMGTAWKVGTWHQGTRG